MSAVITDRLVVFQLMLRLPGTILTQDMGDCVDCGNLTSSGMKQLCDNCLRKHARELLARLAGRVA